jgi:hypothetical protein
MTTLIPFTIINLDNESFHLMIKVYINNRVAKLIVDTGASKTVFDKNRFEKFVKHNDFEKHNSLSSGLGTNSMQAHSTLLKKLKIGELVISDYEAMLLDLTHVNASYQSIGLPWVDGVLGGDILMKYQAVIDYYKGEMKLKYKKTKK